MSTIKVDSSSLAVEIVKQLEGYCQGVTDGVKADEKRVAKETVEEIKQNVPKEKIRENMPKVGNLMLFLKTIMISG